MLNYEKYVSLWVPDMEMPAKILDIALLVQGGILLAFFLAAMLTSRLEKEERAAYVSLLSGILVSLPFLLPFFAGLKYPAWISLVLSGIFAGVLIVLFFPYRGRIRYHRQIPSARFDERDTMFSRRSLVPGTERFDDYYARNPGNKSPDNRFRRLPGLLKAGTRYWDPIIFAAADSLFEKVVKELHPRLEGEVATDRVRLKGETAGPEDIPDSRETAGEQTPEQLSGMLLEMAVDWGAHSAGITELQDYHVYSVGGRGNRYGVEFGREHKYALALTVEMDYDMMRTAPGAPTVLESARQYLQSGMIAVHLAEFIRSLGYPARAHIDGNYKVICPLVARDAGLGEIGRMGLLMTPRLGPRCRIAVLTTDLPLVPGQYKRKSGLTGPAGFDATVTDFCHLCKKCARVCPGQSIPSDAPKKIEGADRWKIDSESCYTYWCQAGTDCGRCMIVCPFSHPDNWFHRLIRFGIRNNAVFRRLAVHLDDIFYGKSPDPRDL